MNATRRQPDAPFPVTAKDRPTSANIFDDALGPCRVVIERVLPTVDGGRFPINRVLGERVEVRTNLVADGHDEVNGCLLFRKAGDGSWSRTRLERGVGDQWQGTFSPTEIGRWHYSIEAWIDRYATWCHATQKKAAAGQIITLELLEAADLIQAALDRPSECPPAEASTSSSVLFQDAGLSTQPGDHQGSTERHLEAVVTRLRQENVPADHRLLLALEPRVVDWMASRPHPDLVTRHDSIFEVVVDRRKARFSAWYEFFPRSFGPSGRHGTFADAEKMLEYAKELCFDVVYLPPIHPIGRTHRKGRNNTLEAKPADPGSPWAIGSDEGGHKSVHPALGTLEDFRRFIHKAESLGLEVALDIALQASADHPYVKEHPEWFRRRPDGTIQYAENPPKKYQDIYPLDFETQDWAGLWKELLSIFQFWIEQGVRIFRVDNPHTKSLRFWAWCIREIKRVHPDVILLAEAFARPSLMYGLAKRGFTQSYTYFTWRRRAVELSTYLNEITKGELSEYYQPSFWPNTPDILPEHLQYAGAPAFLIRLILAATGSSVYGIYGPAFELMENEPRPESGEYLDNEKYELKRWNLEDPRSLRDFVTRINRIRRECPALQQTRNLEIHPTDNDEFLCFSKHTDDGTDLVLVVVNLSPHHRHTGWVALRLAAMGIEETQSFYLHDLLGGGRHIWSGSRNFVELDPSIAPAHIFRVNRQLKREQDFDYFM